MSEMGERADESASRRAHAVVPGADERFPAMVDSRLADARAKDARTDSRLRQLLGYGTGVLMAVQIAVADAVFIVYGLANSWDVPVIAINLWLCAAVVQVVALAHTGARYPFPAP